MSTIAFVIDQVAIGKILDHLGPGTPEAEKPPPPLPQLLRVAEQGDGWGVPAQWDSPRFDREGRTTQGDRGRLRPGSEAAETVFPCLSSSRVRSKTPGITAW